MGIYRYNLDGSVSLTETGAVVNITDPKSWGPYESWIKSGNTPDPAIPDARVDAMKADPTRVALLARLRTATPAQIDTYVQANVTNLAQARDMLGTILKLLALDARQ